MASVHIILTAHKTNRLGEAPIVARIVHGGQNTTVSLRRYLHPQHWDSKNEKVKRSHPNSAVLNAIINQEKAAYQNAIDDLLREGNSFTVKDIIQKQRGGAVGDEMLLVDVLSQLIDTNPENLASTTLAYYNSTLNRIKDFSPNVKLKEINLRWLQGFESFLRSQNNAVNTIHNRLKVIRKVTRYAQRNDWMNHNPFLNFQLKTEVSKREYLTKDELEQFIALNPNQPSYILVKNTFIFSCYSGLRFGDLCLLSSDNISVEKDNSKTQYLRLSMRMSKTNDLITLKLPRQAEEILFYYGYPNPHSSLVLPIMPLRKYISEADLKKTISSRNAYFNKVLQILVEPLGLNKHVSMHSARHTFAVLALQLGIPMEVLSKLLGHRDLKTTQIYGKIVSSSMDDAMDRFNSL
jgi:integrase/recombinase XerD